MRSVMRGNDLVSGGSRARIHLQLGGEREQAICSHRQRLVGVGRGYFSH